MGPTNYRDRFPGFDVMAFHRHWDAATTGVVSARLRSPEPPRFFTLVEEAAADALFDRLLDQHEGTDRIPVTAMVDARLAEQQSDGWHYADLPEDGEAWKRSLQLLDADASDQFGAPFCECARSEQHHLISEIHGLGSGSWHDLPAAGIWSLWTRYACTAFYSHPFAWNEIGFPGPAYPRGYGALGVGKRESFEVRDVAPHLDPATDRASGARP